MADKKQFSATASDAIGKLDATEILAEISAGHLSMVDVTRAAIERARHSQPVLNAVVIDDYDAGLARARNHPTTGNLAGLPGFVKDNLDWQGKRTGFGSRAMPQTVATSNGAVTQQLIDAGMNLIGKSATPPFGFGCSTEFEDDRPPVRNPWHLDYSAGGSSGGAAALVAAGVVPIAHANDGGGSIRIPAAMCGVVGLKPSRGRLQLQRNSKNMPINLIADGVITRSVRDTALFYDAAERAYKPAHLPPLGYVLGPTQKRRRIGFVYDSILTQACPETRATIIETAKLLAGAGHEVQEIPIPVDHTFAADFRLYWGLLAFSVAAFGTRFFGKGFDRSKLDPLTLGLAGQMTRQFWRLPGAIGRLKRTAARIEQRSGGVEVVLTPVIAKVTPKLGHLSPAVPYEELMPRLQNYVGYTPLANVTGFPAISLPMGQSSSGLPIGVQLSAAIGQEAMLLEIAYELEAMKPWPRL